MRGRVVLLYLVLTVEDYYYVGTMREYFN